MNEIKNGMIINFKCTCGCDDIIELDRSDKELDVKFDFAYNFRCVRCRKIVRMLFTECE